ncbi:hypothetical protein GZH47_26650 [Paenibacillus rhizovicinus]|uniref:Uncharacterized protein n=1 Tax=Paenibacillus rhizovicinus TaxID=2704463 RepID=A0A6C0P676_9BACL|nr:hypothetical protein [Paenibacillus rhizovicinus]QHW34019.1 hypothetical protein GZH47_26650 [Paenibacillus rhizovicinus]
MKIGNQVQEDEVIAEFLFAECDSQRYKAGILHALGDHDITLLHKPNLNDQAENRKRRNLLGQTRGFGRNTDLFENFPAEVKWYKAVFEKQDLDEVMYIDYSYWNELSGGTRLPLAAAENIMNGMEVFGVSNQGFIDINFAHKNGKIFPRLILVSMNENSRVVVLEGHARLTAYYLDREYIPDELEVIIGFSEEFSGWGLY